MTKTKSKIDKSICRVRAISLEGSEITAKIDKTARELGNTHRVHRCWVGQPGVVHFLDIGGARSIQEGLSSSRVVSLDARCGEEVTCELKCESVNIK